MQSMRRYRQHDIAHQLAEAGFTPLDILVCGSTGVGKSSTINALFAEEVAAYSDGAQCCTRGITAYMLNHNLRIWDSPGLGDGVEQDRQHIQAINDILQQTCTVDGDECYLIDMALVILNAKSRDLHTSLTLIKHVLAPQLGASRIMLGINQADIALCGRHWNHADAMPGAALQAALEEKAQVDWHRLTRDSGIALRRPFYFSAAHHFNLNTLVDALIEHIPTDLRLIS